MQFAVEKQRYKERVSALRVPKLKIEKKKKNEHPDDRQKKKKKKKLAANRIMCALYVSCTLK